MTKSNLSRSRNGFNGGWFSV